MATFFKPQNDVKTLQHTFTGMGPTTVALYTCPANVFGMAYLFPTTGQGVTTLSLWTSSDPTVVLSGLTPSVFMSQGYITIKPGDVVYLKAESTSSVTTTPVVRIYEFNVRTP